jgi:hypothetical protein
MKFLKQAAVIIVVLVVVNGFTVIAQQEPLRVSDQQLKQLLTRLDTHAENFHKSLAEAINRSYLHDAEIGKYLKYFAWELEQLTDRLQERSQDRKPISSEVQEVLNRGPYLDTFMRSYDFGPRAERDWQMLTADFDQLASYYTIKTYWRVPTDISSPPKPDLGALANRLIGTYKLERTQSEDVRKAIEEAVNALPATARRPAMSALLAIDRQGDKVTLASSLRPARTFIATGYAQTERGKLENVLLYGSQFRLNTLGDTDSFFSVNYASIDQGARLHVTHTALLNQFARPLVIVSYYKKISDVPQLNLDTEEPNSTLK